MNYQDNEIVNYKNALSLILHSNEFKKYGLDDRNYNVSSEIVSFSNFDRFFKDELNKKTLDELIVNEVINSNIELVKLNTGKYGKVKIFFSEQKENVFFAEVFIYKKKSIRYKDRPIFGMSKVFMFKIDNDETSLVSIKEMHYN